MISHIFFPLFRLIRFILACHWRHNVFPDSPLSIHSMQDAGLHHFIVQRPLKGCQSCLIIVSVNLICACDDKIWPLLYVIVWLTCLIHDPTTQTRGESNSRQMPTTVCQSWNSISFFLLCIFFCSFHLSIPVLVSKFQIYVSWEMTRPMGF